MRAETSEHERAYLFHERYYAGSDTQNAAAGTYYGLNNGRVDADRRVGAA